MIKKHLFITLSLLCIKAIITEDFNCFSNFEKVKELSCNGLSDTNSGQYCRLIDNECRDWYKSCEDYEPTSGFEDEICKKIVPTTFNKKCSVKNERGSKKCVMV